MNLSARGVAAATALVLASTMAGGAHAASDLAISQVYGGGGNSGAVYTHDFVEIFNRGTSPVSLAGKSLQYGSTTGVFGGSYSLPAAATVQPGQFYLVQLAGGANGAPLPAPDASSTALNLAGAAGKVALVNGTSPLACGSAAAPCSAAQLGQMIDLVGFGTAANLSETAPTANLGNALAAYRKGNGCTDSDDNSADFTVAAPSPRHSGTPTQACVLVGDPRLSVADVTADEGDDGFTSFLFDFMLDRPAPAGGLTVYWETRAGTATPGLDYLEAGGHFTIDEGERVKSVAMMVRGDEISEPDETFFVDVTMAQGAVVADGEAMGTIRNDDFPELAIADVQGQGPLSPVNGDVVTVEGIVTALKFNNGFFLQTADAEVDADPATSEGIFVFTSTAPPASAAVGNRVRVSATVSEFVPPTNLNQLSITQLTSPVSIQVLSTGNPLPTPVLLSDTLFGPGASPHAAEGLEGMRVTLAAGIVVAPSDGTISEASANSSTTGVYHVVLDGVARPFREPGISVLSTVAIPVDRDPPRFDTNQERLMVRSRGQVGATATAVDTGATVSGVTGVLDYHTGTWALLPDVGSGTVAGGRAPAPVSEPADDDVRIAAFNLLRFFDEVADGNGAATLQAAAVDKRLTKASQAICDFLRAPDIIGVVEVENLRILGLLSARLAATCPSAPQYTPYLVNGNDVGGINVGFLVNTRDQGGVPRVQVEEVTQFGKTTLLDNPDGSTSVLNDRPPLLLRAVVTPAAGDPFPVTVIVNHLRSLGDSESMEPGSSGWPTSGHRVRYKRMAQARYLAELVQARQLADPDERLVLLGDFNAFEVNDGLADLMGIVTGREAPADAVLVHSGHSIDVPLTNLTTWVPAAERYSYVFEGNAQVLDHVVANQALIDAVPGLRTEHARINADFGVDNYGDGTVPLRVSDHDPVLLVLPQAPPPAADLAVTVTAANATAVAGTEVRWTVIATNGGPAAAADVLVSLRLDAALSLQGVQVPAGFTCVPATDGGAPGLDCAAASFAAGEARFDVMAGTAPDATGMDLTLSASVASATDDPDGGNDQAAATVGITSPPVPAADLVLSALPVPVAQTMGRTVVAEFALRNDGPGDAATPRVRFVVDTEPHAKATLAAPEGWSCHGVPSSRTSTTFTCDFVGPFADGRNDRFGVGLHAVTRAPVEIRASATSTTEDPQPDNAEASTAFQLLASPWF